MKIEIHLSDKAYDILKRYMDIENFGDLDQTIEHLILKASEDITDEMKQYRDIFYQVSNDGDIWTVQYYRYIEEDYERLSTVHRYVNRPDDEEIKEDIERTFLDR
ncbi:DNA-directed RNA polymerase subunit delta [Methanosalsum zhilinae DSM 4017]|uniref:DNA-directed RNA polymerase subunit delta n=1 Tax=Methanosalsum zhilinae (strain DSM 4017 / NBRC 107636 / OCM 62 / WeN5) TaxID=679901 RepID=F7XNP7_METZD|nr:DNA-directed RNA polymerase subunit delta [Methanosalsum zhilinae]AEH61248.1 DNA-directed RNA polymerase subunit delta [Methanosalsum zhilinae DSM 4017]